MRRRPPLPSCGTFLAAVLSIGCFAAHADAETPVPAQASADDGAFLPYAPTPASPASVCLIDTGVNVNPDTEGAVIDRMAIDGGSGDDVSASRHGTLLAMMAAGASNGWGMVGTAPNSIKIVSVRVLEGGEETFPFSAYADGITSCLRVREKDHVRVINLSFGSSGSISSQELGELANAIEEAANYGVAVVAAAGNDDAGSVEYPAAFPSVLSVGATDTRSGELCSFSNRGAGLRLLAPGCDLDGADPVGGGADVDYWQGTSESSVIAAASLAALQSYRPDLSPAAAEEALAEADGGKLDIAQAFRNAGLGSVVAAGEAAEPHVSAPAGWASAPGSVPTSHPMTIVARLARPFARIKLVRGRLVLQLTGKPQSAQTEVKLLGHRRRLPQLVTLRTLRGGFSRLALPSTGVTELSLRFIDPYDATRASPWLTLRVPKADKRRRVLSH